MNSQLPSEEKVSKLVFDTTMAQRNHWKEAYENTQKVLDEALSIIKSYYWIESRKEGQAVDERAGKFLRGIGKI